MSGPVGFAAMSGSSICGHDAAPWVTDFLNAVYYRRADADVDDLRLAFGVLTTYWWGKPSQRRLHITDLPAFHRAFGADRLASHGRLDRAQLLAGGARLLGDWFPDAYGDDARRGWGIAFETVEARAAYRPERRLALARLGELTPEHAADALQTWHTYPAVAVPSADRVIALLSEPARWPDFASAIGRFTALRTGGLLGQTFEIEVAAGTDAGRPVFTRGYVTITTVAGAEDAGWFDALAAGLARHGQPPAVPEGATPRLGFDLTTHAGHFLGSGHSRLVVYEQDGQAYVCDAGTWDPLSWHLESAYRMGGKAAQEAFWGGRDPAKSLLHQLAARA